MTVKRRRRSPRQGVLAEPLRTAHVAQPPALEIGRPSLLALPVAVQLSTADSPSDTLLDRARVHWQFGAWDALAAIDLDSIRHHPARAQLALLAASGHQQLGHGDTAQECRKRSLEWGCCRKLVAQALASGALTSLGRAATLLGEDERAIAHYRSALQIVCPWIDLLLVGTARAAHQRTLLENDRQALRKRITEQQQPDIHPVESEAHLIDSDASLSHTTTLRIGYESFCLLLKASNEDTSIVSIVESSHSYEPWLTSLLACLARPDQVVLDIGANIGVISAFLACLDDSTRVYAFEPLPRNLELLRENMAPFGSVTIIDAAAGDRVDPVRLLVHRSSDGVDFGGAMIDTNSAANEDGIDGVRQIRLDDWAFALSLDRLDIVKLDVEGFELNVLRGASGLLARFQPTVFVEFFPHKLRLMDADADLELFLVLSAGWRHVYMIARADGSLIPVRSYAELRALMMTGHGVEDLLCARAQDLTRLEQRVSHAHRYSTYGPSFHSVGARLTATHLGQYPDGWIDQRESAVLMRSEQRTCVNLQILEATVGQRVDVYFGNERHRIDIGGPGAVGVSFKATMSAGANFIFIETTAHASAASYFQNQDPRHISVSVKLTFDTLGHEE